MKQEKHKFKTSLDYIETLSQFLKTEKKRKRNRSWNWTLQFKVSQTFLWDRWLEEEELTCLWYFLGQAHPSLGRGNLTHGYFLKYYKRFWCANDDTILSKTGQRVAREGIHTQCENHKAVILSDFREKVQYCRMQPNPLLTKYLIHFGLIHEVIFIFKLLRF